MTAEQNQVLDALRAYWEKHPELRLGQIVVIAAVYAKSGDTYTTPDADLLRGLEKLEEE